MKELVEAFCRLEIEDLEEVFGDNAAYHICMLGELYGDWMAYFLQLDEKEKARLLLYLSTGWTQEELELIQD